MEFLELAQYFTYEMIKEQNEGKTDSTPDPAMIDMFNSMIDEMFDYGRFILNSKRKNPANDLLSAIANAKIEIIPFINTGALFSRATLENLAVIQIPIITDNMRVALGALAE